MHWFYSTNTNIVAMMYGTFELQWLAQIECPSVVCIGMHTVYCVMHTGASSTVWFGWPQCGGECKQTSDCLFLLFFTSVYRHPKWRKTSVFAVCLGYSGTPLNGHSSMTDTCDITDISECPDCISIDFNTTVDTPLFHVTDTNFSPNWARAIANDLV